MNQAFRIAKLNRFSAPGKLKIEECFGRLINRPQFLRLPRYTEKSLSGTIDRSDGDCVTDLKGPLHRKEYEAEG